jgi:hypothetical protein
VRHHHLLAVQPSHREVCYLLVEDFSELNEVETEDLTMSSYCLLAEFYNTQIDEMPLNVA